MADLSGVDMAYMDEFARKFQRVFQGGVDPPNSLYICFCVYNKLDDSVYYLLHKFSLGRILSPAYCPSVKNIFIEDGDSFGFDFVEATCPDDHDVRSSDFHFSRALLFFPPDNRSSFDSGGSKLRIQMGFSGNGKSSFVLAGGVVGKYQPLRMGFESCPSSEVYGVNPISLFGFQEFGEQLLHLEKLPDLLRGKVRPRLVLLGDKVYALAGNDAGSYSTSPFFEVLDLKVQASDRSWSSLPNPPVFHRYSTNNDESSCDMPIYPIYHSPPLPEGISYAIVGSNIIVSSLDTPTFRFDTAEPSQGWRELVLSDGGKFEFQGTTLAVEAGHHHSLLFAYGGDFERLRLARHLNVSVHMMSNAFDTVVAIAPLRLPEDQLPMEFLMYPPDDYTLLDLGGGTVCLLLSRFMGPYSKFEHKTAKMILLLVKFQFNITENEASPLEIKFLGTHTIEYRNTERFEAHTAHIEMMGAFLQ